MDSAANTPDDSPARDRYADRAGDPGTAAELPASTGRSPATGALDVILDESLLAAAPAASGTDPEGAKP